MRSRFVVPVLFLFFFAPNLFASTFSLTLNPENIDPAETAIVQTFLQSAIGYLPATMKDRLPFSISVHFVPLDNGKLVRVSDREIQLNLPLKQQILPGHQSGFNLAMASLLRGLAHVYDRLGTEQPDHAWLKNACRQFLSVPPEDRPQGTDEEFLCQNLAYGDSRVSNDPYFLSLTNWHLGSSSNNSISRSPDPSELTSPEEAFAVNMEYFLMDSGYACRRPVEFAYLKNLFQYDPFPYRSCVVSTRVNMGTDSLGRASGNTWVDLDPSRIYQIQFLFASEGSQMMSQWGHAMFRLIICAPTRKTVGPDCLADINYHVVVGFQASDTGWYIDSWKGLMGGYPSTLYLKPFFPDVVNSYTVDEFRNLVSLPLRLTEDQKRTFINRVLEQYWGYKSTYFFVNNNCATEALNLLKGVIPDFNFQNMETQSPIGLYETLGATGYIDLHLLDDHQAAIQKGYFFPSQRAIYEKAFESIRQISPELVNYSDFTDLATHSSAAERQDLYNRLVKLGSRNQNLPNYFYVLEIYIGRLLRETYNQRTIDLINSQQTKLQSQLNQLAADSKLNVERNRQLGGYGIPLPQDLPKAFTSAVPVNVQMQALYSQITNWANEQLKAVTQEQQRSQANQKYFLSEMSHRN